MRTWPLAVLVALVSVTFAAPSAAQTSDVPVPEPLEPWVDWVEYEHPEWDCPRLGGERACVWPGRLQLEVTETGGSFQMEVWLARATTVELPGSDGYWPQSVESSADSLLVTESASGGPAARLPAGEHQIRGTFEWESPPEMLPIPETSGRVTLQIEGERIDRPRIDDQHRIWLRDETDGRGKDDSNTIRVSVYRRLQDGVPLEVTTKLEMNVSGRARKVGLGEVLLEATRPTEVDSPLPVQIEGRSLQVYVKPGTHEVDITSVLPDSVSSLDVPEPEPDLYDPQEVWIWQGHETIRSVRLSGLSNVDPDRTSLPEAWHGHTTLLAQPGRTLEWTVTQRGTQPSPNKLELKRELWLDLDGHGYTIRDRLNGTMHRKWRLDYTGDAKLGRVHDLVSEDDLLVTSDPETGARGVELRKQKLQLRADLRLEKGLGETSIVGWDQDVRSLEAALHLPPGWSLFTATGVDSVAQSWLNIWTLWDIFFVLIVAFSIGKLFGWRWTPLALAALGLSYGFSYAPRWTWIHLIVATALLRVLPEGGWRMPVHAYRGVTLVVLGVLLAIFTHSQIQSALHPQTGDSGTFHPHEEATESLFWQVDNESATQRGSGWTEYRGSASQKKKEKVSPYTGRDKLQQVAPNAVVQTGPGVPSWDWTRVELNWSGPVSRDHRIELWLISPMVNRVLAFVRLVLILGLALLLMIRPRGEAEPEPRGSYDRGLKQLRQTLMGRGIVWVVAFGSVGLAARARAQSSQAQQRQASESNASSTENEPPDVRAPGDRWASTLGDQLEELETRMLEASRCQGPCVVVNRLELDIQGRQVTMRGELDVQRDAGWTIPGPRGALALESIRLDGRSTSRLRRASDGLTAVYVPEGRHTVKIEGQLSTQDVVTLRFGDEMRPRHLTFTSDDWTIEGLAPSGSVDNSIQLTRLEQASDQETDSPLDKRVELPPWFQVDRTFELGLPWRVETTISRTNASRPERLQYPLLKGENVITEGVSVESGRARLNFEKGETTVSFESELEVADRLEFRAPEDKPWTETWTLECSRIWRCDTSGIPPTQLVGGGAEISRPVWHPWPGESLTLEVDKPEAVPGESMTIESTTYKVEFGQRLMTGTLTLTIRATQGGQQQVTLPEEATLQSTSIDEETRNFQLNEDQELTIPVTPGSQTIEVSWQQPWERKFTERAPPVDIDGQAVDVETIIDPGDERWILWLEGPEWGPAVLFWSFLMLMLVVAIFLGRLQGLQPTTLEWMLLVAGFSQLPVAAFVPVVAWFALLAIRREYWPDRWWVFNFMQLTIVGLTFVAAGVLYAALHTNFLVDIDMQIQGAQSHSDHLRWYVDRTFGVLPRPSIVTLPLFAWRLLMLGWAIWLVNRLLTWVPWGWESFSRGQLVASWHDDEDEELHDDGEAEPPAEGTIDGDGVPPFARTSEAELSDEPSPERPRDEGEETTPSDETSESRAAPADSPTPSNESKDGENISDAAPDGPEARAETERSSDEASKEGDAPEDSRDD